MSSIQVVRDDATIQTPLLSTSAQHDLIRFLLKHPLALRNALANFDDSQLPPSIVHFRHELSVACACTSAAQAFPSHLTLPHPFPTPPPEFPTPQASNIVHDNPSNDGLGRNRDTDNLNNEDGPQDQSNGAGDGGSHQPEDVDLEDHNSPEPEDYDDDDDDGMHLFDELDDEGFVGEINYINVFGGDGGPPLLPVLPGGGLIVGPDRDCHRDAARARRLRREATRPYAARPTPPPMEEVVPGPTPPPMEEDPQNLPSQQDALGSGSSEQQQTRNSTARQQDVQSEVIVSLACSVARSTLVDEHGEADSLDVHELIKLTLLGPDAPVAATIAASSAFPIDSAIGSLLTAALLCEESALLESQYVRILEFVAQVQQYKRITGENSLSRVYAEIIKAAQEAGQNPPTIAHLKYNYNIGVKLAHVVAAGTPYMLFLLSTAHFKALLNKAPNNHISAIHNLIRCPDDSAQGVLIKKQLIPAIAQLRQKYPLQTSVLFSDRFCVIGGTDPITEHLWDVDGFDRLIENIQFETFVKPRDLVAWAPAMITVSRPNEWNINQLVAIQSAAGLLSMSMGSIVRTLNQTTTFDPGSPPPIIEVITVPKLKIWDNIVNISNLITVETGFDPAKNTRFPCKKDNESRREFTKKHRKYAAKATVSFSEDEFREKLQKQLSSGKKSKVSQYMLIDAKQYDGKILRITDKNGDLIALHIGSMPLHLRQNVISSIEVAFPGMVESIDSAALSSHQFIAYHFSYYNRYCKKGTDAPHDVDPSAESGKHTTPRASREFLDNLDKVDMVVASFRPVFDWIYAQLKILLPEEFTLLEATADVLPLGDVPPMYPFTGFVTNLNVRTIVHRDGCDKDICLVFQFSESTGGELVLVEPGLVFRLRSGDGVVFKSRDVSHFNADYVGKRISFVFQTDAFLDMWVKDRNSWSNNVFMKCDIRDSSEL